MHVALAAVAVCIIAGADLGGRGTRAGGCRPDLDCRTATHLRVGRDCTTIQAAINCIPSLAERTPANGRVAILLNPGVYTEQLVVNKSKISLVGLAPFVPYSYSPHGYCTSAVQLASHLQNEAVLNITANDFILANVTSYDDANKYQIGKNFALYVYSGDRTAVYFSSLFGAQDTVYTGAGRAYFYGSTINGTTDFNYGQGAAVYDNCTIVGEPGEIYKGESFLTAASGANQSSHNSTGPTPNTPEARPSAYLIKNSRLPAVPNAKPTYLGRPWGKGASVFYDNVWMDKHIAASGWYPWWTGCNRTVTTCADVFFAEFNSTGPGAAVDGGGRVQWSRQLTAKEAEQWTTERVLQGWRPAAPTSVWADVLVPAPAGGPSIQRGPALPTATAERPRLQGGNGRLDAPLFVS